MPGCLQLWMMTVLTMKLEVEAVDGVRLLQVVGTAPVGCGTLVLVPTGSLGSSERGTIRPFSFTIGPL